MDIDSQIKLEERLKKLIEKYGKRDEPLDISKFLEEMGFDLEEVEDMDEFLLELENNEAVDLKKIEYHISYEKKRSESFKITADLDLEKSQGGRFELRIIFYDEETVELLREMLEDPDLYNEPASLSLESLYYTIHDQRIKYLDEKYNKPNIKNVLDLTEELFKEKYKKIDNMLEEGIIDYPSLWYHLDRGDSYYVVKNLGEDICFKYKVFCYREDLKEEPLSLIGEIINPSGKELNICEFIYNIPKFKGTKKLDSLKIKLLDDEKREELTNYGKKILDWHHQILHMNMEGKQYFSGPNNSLIAYDRNERVILDYEGLDKYGNAPIEFTVETTVDKETLTAEDYPTIFPMVPVYNLGINKTWGITHIKNLSDIKYKTDAFDYLVLDENKKSIIKCLINHKKDETEYDDFIEGKGNGLVFLLYGSPGTGKTFTAEATCEFLEKPLYSINVGDLGTDPEHMETIMNMIIEYSKRWGAIIMMDEVDIFLEERETNAIIRNAMVGIFLKILEYHDGIIFLTTNRLHSLDSAVKSRINLMISYQEFDSQRRKMIWDALFRKWNLTVDNGVLEELSHHNLNGREIRNYMKIVFAIHKDRKETPTGESILQVFRECLDLTKEFNKSIGAPAGLYL